MNKALSLIRMVLKKILQRKLKGISIHSSNKDLSLISFSDSELFSMPDVVDIFGAKHSSFLAYKVIVPEYYILQVRNGKCIIGHEEVYTERNQILLEITSQKLNPALNSNESMLRSPTVINGSVVNLSLSGLENNYYHYLVEFAARIFMLHKLNIKPDYYILPTKTSFQKEFLNYFDIDISKVVGLSENTVIQAKRLLAPALINNWSANMVRNTIHYQKQYLPHWIGDVYNSFRPNRIGEKNIYISRKLARYRKVINEESIIAYLLSKNFEVHYLENYSVEQQIHLFNQCSVLIAPHGAGLINMCFCAPGIRILELFPRYYHDHSFILQALMLNHKYSFIIGSALNVDGVPPQQEDIMIDMKIFCEAVELLLSQ